MNIASFVGRAGSDPEVKYLDSGKIVVKFSLAVRRAYSRGGTDTDWFSLEIWGKTAEIASNYVHKGSQIGVTGRIEFEEWSTSSGEKRQKAVVKVNDLTLLDPKSTDQPQGQQQYQQQPQGQYQQQPPQGYAPPPQGQPQYQQQPQGYAPQGYVASRDDEF